ncbi:MAG: 1,4-alpha-glucan branching protein GlgB [Clostridia bacterium]|nr:1,4-alpha-glucan branching protein GlgB [Clostridia bacterium]
MTEEKTWANISRFQTYLFNSGDNFKSYEMLGSHKVKIDGVNGWRFAVWAPKAVSVRVVGDFNDWNGYDKMLERIETSGVWYGFFTDIEEGMLYKYAIEAEDGETYYKADPYAVKSELRPGTASVTKDISNNYKWGDKAWISARGKNSTLTEPMNIYEIHIGSWKIHDDGSFYTYRELADELVPYVKKMGYTHIELMPITEYPFDGSWGYQVTGFFSATTRYGESEDLKYLIDKCHKNHIGIIMDWVPAHFPRDAHGLRMFDGTPVYEYADPRLGEHKDWGTMVFDYSKSEVISFLISSAYFWAEQYHIDGIRVDAVSSMLYRDYSRNDGEWVPNEYGGNGNLEAVDFLKKLNKIMGTEFPNFMMVAEESTAWPLVTAPPENDGLGFNYKWNMGWMNDTLRYMGMDPYFRKDNHSLLTFMMMYAYSENYILPLSHDEVVHGKGSMLNKMFGEYDEKFAAYRTLLGYYMTMPGKKMLFMGGEFGQMLEWRYDDQLEWNVLEIDKHKRLHQYVKDLNHFYMENKALWELDTSWDGFRWVNEADSENSVLSYIRRGRHAADNVVVVANFTPVERPIYKIGVPLAGEYEVVFHSSAVKYGGNKRITKKVYKTKNMQFSDMMYTIEVAIDGNSVMFLKKKPADKAAASKKKTNASKTAKKTTDKTESATAKKAAVKETTAAKTAAKKTSTRTNKSAK